MTHSKIEARRAEVEREAIRRRMRVGVVAAGCAVAVGLGYLAIESPLLDVDRVDIRGTRRVTDSEIRTAARIEPGRALLRVDRDAVRDRIEQLAWVESARVERRLPGTLRIVVEEYDAVAYVPRGDGELALLGADGRVIADVDEIPQGAVEVRGVRRVPDIGGLLSPPDAPGVVRVLPSALAHQVVAIDVAGEGVALDLARGGEVRLGSLDDLDAKAAAALAVLARLGDEPFAYVDVRVPQSPVAGEAATTVSP
ncbi:MAG: cell division protein FtsQ/DivIB [Actinomycetota bacterium]